MLFDTWPSVGETRPQMRDSWLSFNPDRSEVLLGMWRKQPVVRTIISSAVGVEAWGRCHIH